MEAKERTSITDCLVDFRYVCPTCGMEQADCQLALPDFEYRQPPAGTKVDARLWCARGGRWLQSRPGLFHLVLLVVWLRLLLVLHESLLALNRAGRHWPLLLVLLRKPKPRLSHIDQSGAFITAREPLCHLEALSCELPTLVCPASQHVGPHLPNSARGCLRY
jgi:hypothetical protein